MVAYTARLLHSVSDQIQNLQNCLAIPRQIPWRRGGPQTDKQLPKSPFPVPEFIDPVFAKTSPKCSFSVIENYINSGTCHLKIKRFCIVFWESYPTVVRRCIVYVSLSRQQRSVNLFHYIPSTFFAIHRGIWERIEGKDPSSSYLGYCLTRWTDKKTAGFKGFPILTQAAV